MPVWVPCAEGQRRGSAELDLGLLCFCARRAAPSRSLPGLPRPLPGDTTPPRGFVRLFPPCARLRWLPRQPPAHASSTSPETHALCAQGLPQSGRGGPGPAAVHPALCPTRPALLGPGLALPASPLLPVSGLLSLRLPASFPSLGSDGKAEISTWGPGSTVGGALSAPRDPGFTPHTACGGDGSEHLTCSCSARWLPPSAQYSGRPRHKDHKLEPSLGDWQLGKIPSQNCKPFRRWARGLREPVRGRQRAGAEQGLQRWRADQALQFPPPVNSQTHARVDGGVRMFDTRTDSQPHT